MPAPAFAFAEADGSFAIPFRPDTQLRGVDIVVEHPRSGTPRNVFALTGSRTVEIVLTSMTVSGRAFDLDGRQVPYATVEILADTPPASWYGHSRPDLLWCPAPQADREGRLSCASSTGR